MESKNLGPTHFFSGKRRPLYLLLLVGLVGAALVILFTERPPDQPEAAGPDVGRAASNSPEAQRDLEGAVAPIASRSPAVGSTIQTESLASVVAETWLPTTPDQSLTGLKTSEVLKLYWGSRWPEVEADLKAAGVRLYEHDTWERESWRRLGDPEESLEKIKRALVDACTPAELLGFNALDSGFRPQAIYSTADVRGSIQRELNRHAVELKVPNAILTLAQTQASESRIADLLQPRAELLDELTKRIKDVVAADLEPVSLQVRPSLGTLLVSASMAWTPTHIRERQRKDPSRWWVSLSAWAGSKSSYMSYYYLLLTDHPQLAELIRQIESAEESLESSLALERQWWIDNCQLMDY